MRPQAPYSQRPHDTMLPFVSSPRQWYCAQESLGWKVKGAASPPTGMAGAARKAESSVPSCPKSLRPAQ